MEHRLWISKAAINQTEHCYKQRDLRNLKNGCNQISAH